MHQQCVIIRELFSECRLVSIWRTLQKGGKKNNLNHRHYSASSNISQECFLLTVGQADVYDIAFVYIHYRVSIYTLLTPYISTPGHPRIVIRLLKLSYCYRCVFLYKHIQNSFIGCVNKKLLILLFWLVSKQKYPK